MHNLNLLILGFLNFASNIPCLAASHIRVAQSDLTLRSTDISDHELANSPSPDATDTSISDDGFTTSQSPDLAFNAPISEIALDLPSPSQPLDETDENPNPSDSTALIDHNAVTNTGEAATPFDTDLDLDIVADKPCAGSGNQPNTKLRARITGACDTRYRKSHSGAVPGDEGPADETFPDGTAAPDMSMHKFNTRPLAADETMDDMCKRFLGGILPVPVCDSGNGYASKDVQLSSISPPGFVTILNYLRNCARCKFTDLAVIVFCLIFLSLN